MEDKKKFKPNPDLKLMDQVREVLRYYHYAYRTEQTYLMWIKRFLAFHEMKRHPAKKGLGRDGQAGKSAPQGSDGSVRLASPRYASTFKAGDGLATNVWKAAKGEFRAV